MYNVFTIFIFPFSAAMFFYYIKYPVISPDKSYSESTLEFPAYCTDIVKEACKICGVPVETVQESVYWDILDSVRIKEKPEDVNLTFRDMLRYCAKIAFSYWRISEDGRIATTKYLADTEIKEFNGEKLDYADVQIECKVANNSIPHENITNIAEISEYTYNETVVPEDRDSKSDDMKENIPEDKDLPDYKKDKEKDDYVPGNEDDDDFEKVYVKELDLALRKFITSVNDEKQEVSRVPVVDVTPLKDGTGTTAIYNHTKEPLSLKAGDKVVYTIRIYNEGEVAGTASEIKDYYDNNDFDMYDIYDISKDTTKEKELLYYVGFEKDYHKSYDKDDYNISL